MEIVRPTVSKFKNFDQFNTKLLDWIKEHGSLPSEKDPELGRMVANVRKYYKTNKLTLEEVDRLNAIKEWYFSHDDLLNKNCDELIKFIRDNKKVPSEKGKIDGESELGRLSKRIREKNRQNKLPDNIKDKFKEIGDLWYWDKDVFEDNLKKLTEYVEEHNEIPKRKNANNSDTRALALWISLMKTEQKEGKMPEDKFKKLNNIKGWVWFVDDFDENYANVEKWIVKYNEFPRESDNDQYEKSLSLWIKKTKQKMTRGSKSLTDDRISKLNTIGIFPMGKRI